MDQHPLVTVSESVREETQRAARVAVIFDLDSTLFCVSPRTQYILRRLGTEAAFAAQFAEVAAILREIEVLPTDYSVREVLARTNARPSEEMALQIRAYWKENFFSSLYLDKDLLYPSASEYVNHLHDLGADILYLTGRGAGAMREGTLKALYQYRFPLFSESKLFMKPTDSESDEHFKVTVLKDLVHEYDYVWFFENEPLIIQEVRAAVPQVRVVFVKSAHSKKAVEPTDLPMISPDYKIGLPRK